MKKVLSILLACLTIIGLIMPVMQNVEAATEVYSAHRIKFNKVSNPTSVCITVPQTKTHYYPDKYIIGLDSNKSGVIFASRTESSSSQNVTVTAKKAGTAVLTVEKYSYDEQLMQCSIDAVFFYKFTVKQGSSGAYITNTIGDMLGKTSYALKFHKYNTADEAFYSVIRSTTQVNIKGQPAEYVETIKFGSRNWNFSWSGLSRVIPADSNHIHDYKAGKCKICGLPQNQYKDGFPQAYYSTCLRKGFTKEITSNGSTFKIHLPYGYTKSKKYNVVVLIPGINGTRHNWFSTAFSVFGNSTKVKGENLIDWLIYKGDCEPFIAISGDIPESSTPSETYRKYASKLKGIWLPYVIKNYSTYAADSSDASIIKARSHFIIAGCSAGGSATGSIGIIESGFYMGKFFGTKILISGYNQPATLANNIKKSAYANTNKIFIANGGSSDWETYKLAQEYKKVVPSSVTFLEYNKRGHNWGTFFSAFMACMQKTSK